MDKDLPLRAVSFTGAAVPCTTEAVLSAGCAVLRVTYVPAMAALEDESMQDALEIVIAPDELVFHATYRPASDYRLVQDATRQPIRDRSERLVIALDRAYFQSTAEMVSGSGAAMLSGRYSAADNLMRELGNALLRDFRVQRVPPPTYLEALAGVIAVHLATHHCVDRAPVLGRGLPRHKLERVLRFIHEHIEAGIHVDELAATAHMSVHHFARMFKEAMGIPPHRYITLRRVDHAKQLLTDTDLPLVDVAAAVGFQTQGHFTSVFRKHAGVTPRTFRLACPGAPAASRMPGHDLSCSQIRTASTALGGSSMDPHLRKTRAQMRGF
jgi:AraC family transcriptional regulator